MAEIDTRPLESVQAAVSIFDRGGDQNKLCLDRNEEETISILTKELAACKLQLEVRESQHKQASLKIEALEKAVRDLSDQYEKDCVDAHMRIAQLESENIAIMSRQAEADGERGALREELAAARGELDAARASVAFVLREVEAMETRAILERESTRDALSRILQLNETVLSSAVAAIRAEEERSVFFQEATMEFFDSDRNLEVIRRQVEMAKRMEAELVAKTVENEYLRSELKLAKEISVSPADQGSDATTTVVATAAVGCSSLDGRDQVQACDETTVRDTEACDATTVVTVAAGCNNLDDHVQVQACETTMENLEPEAEFTFQHSPEECFVSEIFRNDGHVKTSDSNEIEIEKSEDVVEDKQGSDAMVQDTTVAEGNSDAQETSCCLDANISREDHQAIKLDGKNNEAENDRELAESDGVLLPNPTACQGNDLLLQDHEEAKADASFVLESSRDDFQSARSDAKDIISIADDPGNIATAGSQEPPAEAAAAAPTSTSTPRECNPENCVVDTTEIVSNKDEDGEFYTKELEPEPGRGQQGGKCRLDGYVLVSRSGGDAEGKQLDAARAEISDLRFSLEEAVRRAELAEEAKAALERELREELRRKQQRTPSRQRAASDSEDGGGRPARGGAPTTAATPARARPPPHAPGATPSRALRSARPGGEDMPTPRCLTLGKVLNMKYK